MAQAAQAHTTTRRGAVRGIALGIFSWTAGAAVAPALAGAAHPDAELLALGRELDEAVAAERRIVKAAAGKGDPALDQLVDEACSRTAAACAAIEKMRATSVEGMVVKAKAIDACTCGELAAGTDTLADMDSTDIRIADGLIKDLLAFAG